MWVMIHASMWYLVEASEVGGEGVHLVDGDGHGVLHHEPLHVRARLGLAGGRGQRALVVPEKAGQGGRASVSPLASGSA